MPQAPTDKKALGAKLRWLRLERKMTQYDVAAAILGSADRHTDVSKWESGRHMPSDPIKTRLASFFGVDL